MEKEGESLKRHIFWIVLALIVVLSYFILRNFLLAFITAFILAFLLKPVHAALSKKIPKKISALLIVTVSVFIIIGIVSALTASIIFQFSGLLKEISWEQILALISSVPYYNLITDNLDKITENLTQTVFQLISSSIFSLPNLFVNLLIVIFATYYLLIDWDSLEGKLVNLIPFSNKKQIVTDSKKITHEIVFGTFIVALIEIIVATLGFYALGIKFYLVLGILVGLLAFIPLAGPVFVWLPVVLFELALGNYTLALGTLLLGLILSFGIDFFLRVKILGSRTQIHPIIMLFGVLGGVQIFGLMGFIVGPLILSIAITIINSLPKNKK